MVEGRNEFGGGNEDEDGDGDGDGVGVLKGSDGMDVEDG